MKQIQYLLEAAGLYILYFFFSVLPPETASNIGGWLGRTIGPRMGASKKADKHLKLALPKLSAAEREKIILQMWDNLGRVIAEYPHLEQISRENTEVEGREIVEDIVEGDNAAIFIAGHLGNWELCGATLLTQHGYNLDLTYRAPNNPWADRLVTHARTLGGQLRAYTKSREGGRNILAALKEKRYLGILIDQKYNEGIAADFFGHRAMTNPVFAQLAQKYNCPLVFVRNQRIGPMQFRLTVHEPIDLSGSAEDVIARAHKLLEEWIADDPGQWLWLHRRWDSKSLSN